MVCVYHNITGSYTTTGTAYKHINACWEDHGWIGAWWTDTHTGTAIWTSGPARGWKRCQQPCYKKVTKMWRVYRLPTNQRGVWWMCSMQISCHYNKSFCKLPMKSMVHTLLYQYCLSSSVTYYRNNPEFGGLRKWHQPCIYVVSTV